MVFQISTKSLITKFQTVDCIIDWVVVDYAQEHVNLLPKNAPGKELELNTTQSISWQLKISPYRLSWFVNNSILESENENNSSKTSIKRSW
jgi:hypothetical protein